MNKRVVGAVVGAVLLLTFPVILTSFSVQPAKAESVPSVFITNVDSVLSQSIESCGTTDEKTAALTNVGSIQDNHFSSCYVVVHTTTNAPGYNLMIQSIDGPQRSTVDSNNNWKYDVDSDGDVDVADNYAIPYGDGAADGSAKLMQVATENTPPTLPTLGNNYIAPTNGTITSPIEMDASSSQQSAWGFAVPKTQAGTAVSGFDNNYSTFSSSSGNNHGKYAKVPTAASSIRVTSYPATDDTTTVFFGTSVAAAQPPGVYKGVTVFTVVANPIVEPAPKVLATYPTSGSLSGGTTVNIYGAYFMNGATTATIGGTTCGSATVLSAGHLTCTLPAKPAGSYPVAVTTQFGQSDGDVLYTYTATPSNLSENPYEQSGQSSQTSVSQSSAQIFSNGGLVNSGDSGDNNSTKPQGRSVFENLVESLGKEEYNSLWIAIGAGALLSCLLVVLSFILGRKWDIYIMNELGENRSEIVKILVEKVGLDVKLVTASLSTVPSLVVDRVSKCDAEKIIKLLEKESASVKIIRHGRKLNDRKG